MAEERRSRSASIVKWIQRGGSKREGDEVERRRLRRGGGEGLEDSNRERTCSRKYIRVRRCARVTRNGAARMGHLRGEQGKGRGARRGLSNKPTLLRHARAFTSSRNRRVTTRGFQPATSFTPYSRRDLTFPTSRSLLAFPPPPRRRCRFLGAPMSRYYETSSLAGR